MDDGYLDPRWEWEQIQTGDGTYIEPIKVACRHLEVVPVESGGAIVAHLCLTCDEQLP